MYRCLIAFDMDGTLLNSKKNIPFLTKQYLRHLSKKGHIIVLASGRPERDLMRWYDELKLDTPMVSYSGAHMHHPHNPDFPGISKTMKKELAIKLTYDLFEKNAIDNALAEIDHDAFLFKDEDIGLKRLFDKELVNLHIGDYKETMFCDPRGIMFESREHKDLKAIEEEAKKIPGMRARFWFDGRYSEIYHIDSEKAVGIQMIADYYNIPNDRIICFGDSDNDIKMLQAAKYGVAMKNADVHTKEAADIITKKDNDHNGIISTLKSILKQIN